MVVRPGEWWWLKEFHLYRCLFFMAAVVIAQYCSRTIAGDPYLMVGSGLSNVAGPSLFFLTPAYTPEFYIDKLWLSENHVFFTIMIFLGLPFCWAQRGFRYVFTVLVMLWFLHTNFLAALSPRYCYYYQPLVILAGSAAAITLYDRLVSLAHRAGDATVARVAAHATGLAVLTLLGKDRSKLVAVVGHQPGLGHLLAACLLGDGGALPIELKKNAVACVSFEASPGAGHGALKWLATPRMLRGVRRD